MKEHVIITSCDACWDETEHKTSAEIVSPVGLFGSYRTLDLCATHQHIFDKLREMLAEHGTKPTEREIARPTRPGGAIPPPPVPASAPSATHRDAPMPCPFCDQSFARHTLRGHLVKVHGAAPIEQPEACPDCGMTNAGRLGVHRAKAHGWDPIAELIASVRGGA